MRKSTLALTLALVFLTTVSQAAKKEAPLEDAGLDIESELAPPPEPPYPGSEEGAYAADPTFNKKSAKARTQPEPEKVTDVERPVRVDEDENYYYDTKETIPKPNLRPGVVAPKSATHAGDFMYDSKIEKPKFSGRAGVEAPIETLESGEYRYKVESSKPRTSASFRFGGMTPPAVKNSVNGVTFAELYGKTPQPVLLGDYEFRLTSKVGRFGIKVGSGVMVSNAGGRFKSPSRQTERPDERFTFVLFPNTATLSYKFQYAEKQILVPFVEGGGGYYTFTEIRDDGKSPKYGGSGVLVAAGGVNVLLDWLDPHAIRQLDLEYGINHVWLTLEMRSTVGLKKDIDFTSVTADAGFMMDF